MNAVNLIINEPIGSTVIHKLISIEFGSATESAYPNISLLVLLNATHLRLSQPFFQTVLNERELLSECKQRNPKQNK
jgi:hypothetical protein